jgi:hypothetical protein
MASVRIIATPAGEAPLSVREAWVGLVLPLKVKFTPVPTKLPQFGVLSGPKTAIGQIFRYVLGRHPGSRNVYLVDPVAAIEVLKEKDHTAAEWWLTNVPHFIRPNWSFGFEAEVCEFLPDEGQNASKRSTSSKTG